jgi:hypothetical protein
MSADTLLNLLVWGLVLIAVIVVVLEYARHRGSK